MGRPSGSIIEATIKGTFHGQAIMNVWHYMVVDVSTLNNVAEETEDFLDGWFNEGLSQFWQSYVAVMPQEWTADLVRAQFISDVRYRAVTKDASAIGGQGGSEITNIQASVTYADEFAGRSHVGAKRFLLPTAAVNNGVLLDTYKTTLATHVASSLNFVTGPTGGSHYYPVIYHRSAPSMQRGTFIKSAYIQDTSRVMRRRTVGLGI